MVRMCLSITGVPVGGVDGQYVHIPRRQLLRALKEIFVPSASPLRLAAALVGSSAVFGIFQLFLDILDVI